VPNSLPINVLTIQQIVKALAGVTIAGGYNVDLKAAVRRKMPFNLPKESLKPVVFVGHPTGQGPDEEPGENPSHPILHMHQHCNIVVPYLIEQQGGSSDLELEEWLAVIYADIRKALMANEYLDGYADKIDVDPPEYGEASVWIHVTIVYQMNAYNPYSRT